MKYWHKPTVMLSLEWSDDHAEIQSMNSRLGRIKTPLFWYYLTGL